MDKKHRYIVYDTDGRPIQINGQYVLKTQVVINPPLRSNDRNYHIKANVVEWHNTGNIDVLIDGGYTVKAGQSRTMENTEAIPIFDQGFSIKFLTSDFDGEAGTEDPKLEVTEIRLAHERLQKT